MFMHNRIKNEKMNRELTFSQALREAIEQAMDTNPDVFVIGLGVTDPNGIFGTTLGLDKRFPSNRVFDMPVSENAMTGVAVGAAINGMRPLMVHQRSDFMLMAMDQIINNAAKWYYMYAGQKSVPLTIRTIVGRGWGQGPQHSQNFQAIFAHIPGLKVITPTTPYEAKGLLIGSIEENNPVIFIEHRWLFDQRGHVPEEYYSLPLGKAHIMRPGNDISIITNMEMAVQANHVAEKLEKHNVSVEVINLCSIKPLDEKAILETVTKTGHLLIIDSGWTGFGVSAEISALVAEKGFDFLKTGIRRIGLPDAPVPTSPGLSKYYYPSEAEICRTIAEILDIDINFIESEFSEVVNDVPDKLFHGPF